MIAVDENRNRKDFRSHLLVDGRRIGPGEPVYIVAELSANHRGDYEEALRLVRAAAEAGADAVKVQTLTPGGITLDADGEEFTVGGGTDWTGRRLYDLYAEVMMPWEWQPKLKRETEALGLDFFSSPFEPAAVDFLAEMDVPCYKVASFELVDIPLIRRMAATGKPLILSTGMASGKDIDTAVAAANDAGCRELALLKCTSAYPTPLEEMNLRAMPMLAERWGVVTGLSDHSRGPVAPITATALGAAIIEKHFTLDRAAGGPDASFSLEPDEFASMVAAVRDTEKALGRASFGVAGSSEKSLIQFRRSLFVVEDVAEGERFSEKNVRSIRPGTGLPPVELPRVLGAVAAKPIRRGTPLAWDLIRGDA